MGIRRAVPHSALAAVAADEVLVGLGLGLAAADPKVMRDWASSCRCYACHQAERSVQGRVAEADLSNATKLARKQMSRTCSVSDVAWLRRLEHFAVVAGRSCRHKDNRRIVDCQTCSTMTYLVGLMRLLLDRMAPDAVKVGDPGRRMDSRQRVAALLVPGSQMARMVFEPEQMIPGRWAEGHSDR